MGTLTRTVLLGRLHTIGSVWLLLARIRKSWMALYVTYRNLSPLSHPCRNWLHILLQLLVVVISRSSGGGSILSAKDKR
jgi:hypothetical protein